MESLKNNNLTAADGVKIAPLSSEKTNYCELLQKQLIIYLLHFDIKKYLTYFKIYIDGNFFYK